MAVVSIASNSARRGGAIQWAGKYDSILRNGGNDLVDGELHSLALDRRVQALVPGSILARRPKRQSKRHKKSHGKATTVAKN